MSRAIVVLLVFISALLAPASALVVCPASMAAGQTYYCFFSVTGQEQAPSQLDLVPAEGGAALAVATADAQNRGLYRLVVPAGAAPGDYLVQLPSDATVRSEVKVAAKAALLLLEADRALYKPGTTVRFRALALSAGLLRPQGQRDVTFEVRSPEGFKLLSVAAVTDAAGVATFEFPISKEPLLGDHSARVSLEEAGQGAGAVAEASFTVEEYVLPRFEVNLSVDQSFISVGSGSSGRWGGPEFDTSSSSSNSGGKTASATTPINGKVSASFTFGEPVVGSATVVAWAPLSRWEQQEQEGKDEAGGKKGAAHKALASVTGIKLTAAGPAPFELPVPSDSLMSGTNIVLEATVVYGTTGERQSSTQNVPVRYKGSELQASVSLEDGGKVFRPGLPFTVRVELTKPDGQAPSSQEIREFGQLLFVVEKNTVDWDHRVDPSKQALDASSFVDGALTMPIPTEMESADCCNPSASRETWTEHQKACGCCITTMDIFLERRVSGRERSERVWHAPEGKAAQACVRRAYSPEGYFLSVSPPVQDAAGRWSSALRSTLDPARLTDTLEYVVLQAGAVAGSSTAPLPTGFADKGGYWERSLPLNLPTISGDGQLLVIARPKERGRALAASAKFSRSLQLPFPLSASFSAEEVKPGTGLSVELEAGACVDTGLPPRAAHAFVASLDRSAELLGQRAAIGESTILAALAKAGEAAEATPVAAKPWHHCGSFGDDIMVAAELPEDVQVVTDAATESRDEDDATYGRPLASQCPRPLVDSWACGGGVGGGGDEMAMMEGAVAADGAGGAAPPQAKSSTSEESGGSAAETGTVAVRKFFPETWLWTDLALTQGGNAASASLAVTAPDTITTWSLEAFATSPDGISAVRAQKPLRVFKPFFVEVRLPYAAVRGEDLEVIFAVFNYVEGSSSLAATLEVTLPPEVELVEGEASVQLTVPEGSAVRSTMRVRPKALGTWKLLATARASSGSKALSDALERPLLVRPEGISMSQTQNLVIDLSGSTSSSASNSLQLILPDNAVEGSARLAVSAVGDLLGPTISGLERLLRIPTGCGEQNMITLAPNVYVAKYLLAVGQLRPDIRQRIVNNMVVGYGRELTYRHPDGSFSAFGKSDNSGSTWLTAFVVRTFAEVQGTGLVSVDTAVLEQAGQWLLEQQASDGSFKSVGKVIHQEMMGGVSGSAALPLTAYVASALAKAKAEVPNLAVSGLDSALQQTANYLSGAKAVSTYTALLRAHALALSGMWTTDQVASEALQLSKTTSAGNRFWGSEGSAATEAEDAMPGARGYGSGVKTMEVEMTGYGVLALTLASRLTEAFEGARWLLERRSASGGFSSTQDTVVALNALATYATAAGRNVDLSLKVKDGASFQQEVKIAASNVDLLQSMTLPVAPGNLSVNVEATGKGVALVMADLEYNIPESAVEPCFDVEVDWYSGDSELLAAVRGCSVPRPACEAPAEAMSIMSIGLFTGYAPSVTALEALKDSKVVKRFEVADARVDLYLEEMATSGKTCAAFNVTKEFKVWNTQPAVSQVYAYYTPETRGESLTTHSFKAMTSDVASLPGVAPRSETTSETKVTSGSPATADTVHLSCTVWVLIASGFAVRL